MMLCELCRKHNPTKKRIVWIEIPCHLWRRKKLCEHQRSKCHMDSVCAESNKAAVKLTGGQVSIARANND